MSRPKRRIGDGEGVREMLRVFGKIGPYDRDLDRFTRLDARDAAFLLEDALIRLPELRRTLAYRVMHTIMRAVREGGGWQYWMD
jgi:hypothetical protein